VYSGDPFADLRGRDLRGPVELSLSVLRSRRKNARKIAKLARVLASLDEQARTVRPAPKRASRASFGAL
jgi:hypothetical protein